MLIKKFEEQVRRTPQGIAVKDGDEAWSYEALDDFAGRIGGAVSESLGRSGGRRVAILLDHGAPMIAAVLGVLKAGHIYVPLSPEYPDNRVSFMLDDSETALLISCSRFADRVGELAEERGIEWINTDEIFSIESSSFEAVETEPGAAAYILYTSGSTGRPKGVLQTCDNTYYFIRNWIKRFNITSADRITLLSSFCHDASIPDIWAALLTGACLYPFYMRERETGSDLSELLVEEKITVWHSVASLYSFFVNSLEGEWGNASAQQERFPHLRLIQLGGEAIRKHDIDMFNKYFPGALLAGIYGQTESTFNSAWLVRPGEKVEKIEIGEPIDETELLLIDEHGNEAEPLETGEIVVACPHISPGYWKQREMTEKVFTDDPDLGPLYWTGDLGRLLLDGGIEFIGRKDSQVKIRGYRIETGEIESRLLKFPRIQEAVVTAHTDNMGDPFLTAYYVPRGDGELPGTMALRDFLGLDCPDYMIPSYFVPLEKFPLTATGKIDRKGLPEPAARVEGRYVAPRDAMEAELTEIWAEVLGIEKKIISIDAGFFQLGGHSLKATTMVAAIHQAFNVKLPLAELFKNPSVADLAEYIKKAGEDGYSAIQPAEKKEYYPVSSPQKRLYILQQLDPDGAGYNMSFASPIDEDMELSRIEETFRKLIDRHESLRTSFHLVDKNPVQKVHPFVEFSVHYEEVGARSYQGLMKGFIRPFDLSRAPLLRVGVFHLDGLEDNQRLLILDMHHIITDGTSRQLLMADFAALYSGNQHVLPPLPLQFKDYAQWLSQPQQVADLEGQETYWLDLFAEPVPVVNLPTDFPRPAVQRFEGRVVHFSLDKEETGVLRTIASDGEATLYMVLLALFKILISKLSGVEDVVMGTPVAGRRHVDLLRVIGMFVNTLAMRSAPAAEKGFGHFLGEVKQMALDAFDNQEYPFEELVDRVSQRRDTSRNPLFDVMLVLQNMVEISGDVTGNQGLSDFLAGDSAEEQPAKFDLTLVAVEVGETLQLSFEYAVSLFKKETIHRFVTYFKNILREVGKAPERCIGSMDMVSETEKRRILEDFNDTGFDYPREKTIDSLLEEQAAKRRDGVAVTGHCGNGDLLTLSNGQLNHGAQLLAESLKGKGVVAGTVVGIMVKRSPQMLMGLLAILKAGGAYMPIDAGYPVERINYMLTDSSARLLLTSRESYEKLDLEPVSN